MGESRPLSAEVLVERTELVNGLKAALLRYGGFEYDAILEPTDAPTAVTVTRGSGTMTTAGEELCTEISPLMAHELTRMAAAGVTVAAVARRWGWTSPSQFTAAYQRRFGDAPSRTLRT